MDKLYIIIPAYNEEVNIESVTREWHEVIKNIGCNGSKLVVIDDGSLDSTFQKLCDLKHSLPYLEPLTKENSGHGSTVLYGYQYAINSNADFIFQTDSDGQTISSEFYNFWNQRNTYSVIIGYRNKRKDGIFRIFVTKVLKFVLYCIFGLKIRDANTPYRLYKHDILKKYIAKIPKDYNLSNVLLTVLISKANENIKFLPITFKQRQGGINSINFKKIAKIGIKAIKDFEEIKKHI